MDERSPTEPFSVKNFLLHSGKVAIYRTEYGLGHDRVNDNRTRHYFVGTDDYSDDGRSHVVPEWHARFSRITVTKLDVVFHIDLHLDPAGPCLGRLTVTIDRSQYKYDHKEHTWKVKMVTCSSQEATVKDMTPNVLIAKLYRSTIRHTLVITETSLRVTTNECDTDVSHVLYVPFRPITDDRDDRIAKGTFFKTLEMLSSDNGKNKEESLESYSRIIPSREIPEVCTHWDDAVRAKNRRFIRQWLHSDRDNIVFLRPLNPSMPNVVWRGVCWTKLKLLASEPYETIKDDQEYGGNNPKYYFYKVDINATESILLSLTQVQQIIRSAHSVFVVNVNNNEPYVHIERASRRDSPYAVRESALKCYRLRTADLYGIPRHKAVRIVQGAWSGTRA